MMKSRWKSYARPIRYQKVRFLEIQMSAVPKTIWLMILNFKRYLTLRNLALLLTYQKAKKLEM